MNSPDYIWILVQTEATEHPNKKNQQLTPGSWTDQSKFLPQRTHEKKGSWVQETLPVKSLVKAHYSFYTTS